jgi:hypothetical protein
LAWYVEQKNNCMQSNSIKQKLVIICLVVVLAGQPAALGAETGEVLVSVHEPSVRKAIEFWGD